MNVSLLSPSSGTPAHQAAAVGGHARAKTPLIKPTRPSFPWPRWLDGWVATWLATFGQVLFLLGVGFYKGGGTLPPIIFLSIRIKFAWIIPIGFDFVSTINSHLWMFPMVHLFVLPIFAYRKYLFFKRPVPDDPAAAELDPEARTKIFSARLSCCDKLVKYTLGLYLRFVSFFISLFAKIGLDLTSAWFPEPFWNFYCAKLTLRSYQIDGCKMRFEARQEDAYLKFQYEAVMNFWTKGLFKMIYRRKKSGYNRWLDKKIKWRGAPPPGYNNQFRVFHTKVVGCKKLKVELLRLLLFPLIVLSDIPIIGILFCFARYADMYFYEQTLSNYLFGGSKPYFDRTKWTFEKYVHMYYCKTCNGGCSGILNRWIDSCIVMGPPVFDPEHDDDAPEEEPSPDGSEEPAAQPAMQQMHMQPLQVSVHIPPSQPAEVALGPRFDTNTGLPLAAQVTPVAQAPRFDTNTGLPLEVSMQPAHPVAESRFDIHTGAPIQPAAPAGGMAVEPLQVSVDMPERAQSNSSGPIAFIAICIGVAVFAVGINIAVFIGTPILMEKAFGLVPFPLSLFL